MRKSTGSADAAALPGNAGFRPDPLAVLAALEERYGVPVWHARLSAMDELVACILSQHTSDANSFRAFDRLKRAYPDWRSVVDAPVSDIADTIRAGGLADTKAARIQNVLREIERREGSFSLEALRLLADGEASRYLIDLPGVGPKTAAIVLCFAMGRPVIPVDTHVFRVAWRIGFIERKAGEAKAHGLLQSMVPAEAVYRFHVALITHGRQVCRAPRPKCAECPVTAMCRYYAEQSANQPGEDPGVASG